MFNTRLIRYYQVIKALFIYWHISKIYKYFQNLQPESEEPSPKTALGDWALQTDPMGYQDSTNLYQGMNMNPVNFVGPFGEELYIEGYKQKALEAMS
jgi:hypothetical protein